MKCVRKSAMERKTCLLIAELRVLKTYFIVHFLNQYLSAYTTERENALVTQINNTSALLCMNQTKECFLPE